MTRVRQKVEISTGETKAMFNSLIYLWSQRGYNYDELPISERRLMTRKRFDRLVSFKDHLVDPDSRLGELLPKEEIPTPVQTNLWQERAIEAVVPLVEESKESKEDIFKKLMEAAYKLVTN